MADDKLDIYLNVYDLAYYLDIHPHTAYRLIRSGKIRAKKMPAKGQKRQLLRIKVSWADQFLQKVDARPEWKDWFPGSPRGKERRLEEIRAERQERTAAQWERAHDDGRPTTSRVLK